MITATIANRDFRRMASSLAAIIERRNCIPVLGCIRFEVLAGKIIATGTNLDIELVIVVEAETTGTGTFLVDARRIANFAAASDGPITLVVTVNKSDSLQTLELRDTDLVTRSSLLIPASDFPDLFKVDQHAEWLAKAITWSMSQAEAARMLKTVAHCISFEETRYYLNGVYLTNKPHDTTLRMVATDGHRMGLTDSDVEVGEVKFTDIQRKTKEGPEVEVVQKGAIVPHKTIRAIMRHLDHTANEPAAIALGPRHIAITLPGLELRSKLIDGTFPDYTRVIPQFSDNITAHLSVHALRRMWAASAGSALFRHAKLDPDAGKISTRDGEGGSIEMPLQASIKGDQSSRHVGFNLSYLLTQGNCTPTFSLFTANQHEPATIRSDDPHAMWLLMPCRI